MLFIIETTVIYNSFSNFAVAIDEYYLIFPFNTVIHAQGIALFQAVTMSTQSS